MKRSDVVTHVVRRASLSRTDAASAVDAVFEAIRDALAVGDKVTVAGFGAFATESRAARTGRPPGRRRVSHRRTEGSDAEDRR
ncbi:MAG: HU family DNA-binding protein [Bryobacterales bacterium]|nr:HU family DNA-binding protein [Bryobacterales bacterium]